MIVLNLIGVLYSTKKSAIIETLPSSSWLFLMIIPFGYSRNFFNSDAANSQFLGISIIFFALQFGDYLSIRKHKVNQQALIPEYKSSLAMRVCMVIVLLFPIFHIVTSDSLPLFDKSFNAGIGSVIQSERETYTKFTLPSYLMPVSNWVINIFGPFLIIKLFKSRRFFHASLFFLWVLFYASISTAQLPIIIFFGSLIFGTFFIVSHRVSKNLVSFILIFYLFVLISGITYGNSILMHQKICQIPVEANLTPGNLNRSCPPNFVVLNPVLDRISYRLFLTPVEVSNKWYGYFGREGGGERSMVDLFNRELPESAANQVGVWGFQTPFPNRYLDSVSAYGSIDADAYSFYGLLSVLFSAFLLFIARVFIGTRYLYLSSSFSVLKGLSLFQMVIFPFQSSLQAIFYSQGLFILLSALAFISFKMLGRFSHKVI
jgi:hypothetical protein